MTLGQKITNLRKARGMTQEELSEAVGVTRQTISKWELDTSTPDLDYLCKLCDIFGVTADGLIRPEREAAEASPSLQTEQTVSAPQGAPTPPPPAASSAQSASGSRWKKPLFIVMWAVWLFWTCAQFIITTAMLPVSEEATNGINVGGGMAFILTTIPWFFYTAFCIGMTVGVICKSARAKRAKR